MKNKIKSFVQELGILSLSFTIASIALMGVSVAKGWVEPGVEPPLGNVGAPINTGNTTQYKEGNLVLNQSGTYANGLTVNGDVTFVKDGHTMKLGIINVNQGEDIYGAVSVISSGVPIGSTAANSAKASDTCDGQSDQFNCPADLDKSCNDYFTTSRSFGCDSGTCTTYGVSKRTVNCNIKSSYGIVSQN